MRCYDPRAPLIFVHVPKSAGSSVREVFMEWFSGRFHELYIAKIMQDTPDIALEEVNHVPRHVLRRYDRLLADAPVIFGHFNRFRGFGIEENFPRVTQFVTILRDPFEIAVSNFFYVRDELARAGAADRMPRDLAWYLESSGSNILNHFPRTVTAQNYRDIIDEFFIEIGLVEFLPESLARIARKLGRDFDPSRLPHRNAAARTMPVHNELRASFERAHPLEFEVYEYVKSRWLSARS